ncbi:hypothetical protein LCGC14_2498670 [marine sediment metagenome]|uniref:Uncharacterized protein n=1 Tax=marine sediment metagenome TaxID=412755 RepID=A0A0F9DWB7_9ZZZZ
MVLQILSGQQLFVDITLRNDSPDTAGIAYVRVIALLEGAECDVSSPPETGCVHKGLSVDDGNSEDGVFNLSPGQQMTKTFAIDPTFLTLLPSGSFLGIDIAVRDQPNKAGNVLAQAFETQQVQITAPAQVPFGVDIVTVDEHL